MKRSFVIILSITALLLTGCGNNNNPYEAEMPQVKDYDSATVQEELQGPYILVDFVKDRYGNVIQKTIYNTETKMTHIYNYYYEHSNGYFVLKKIDTIVVDQGEEPYFAD